MLGKVSDIWDVLVTNVKYSPSEKHKLSELCIIAGRAFQDEYHQDAFKLLGIEEPIPDHAVVEKDLKFSEFIQNPGHPFNGKIKQITESIEGYLDNPQKTGTSHRINKMIAIVLHKMTSDKLFVSRYDTPEEIVKRISEIRNLQDWVGGIIESEKPRFIDDKDFEKVLGVATDIFGKIDDILATKKEEIERHDIFTGFEGESCLKTVIDNVLEYMSSLSGNTQGFSASKLFQDANLKDSAVQKFLIGTNIGRQVLTHFIGSISAQELFSSTPNTDSIYLLLVDDVDLKLEINKGLWEKEDTKKLIVDSLSLLCQLASSAKISKEIKANFSGAVGNVMLLVPEVKNRVSNVFLMTSDGLTNLQGLLKSISQAVEELSSLTIVQKTRLKRLLRSYSDVISEVVRNYKGVVSTINTAPPAKNLASDFCAGLTALMGSIGVFHTGMLSLLPSESHGRYALINNNGNALAMARADNGNLRWTTYEPLPFSDGYGEVRVVASRVSCLPIIHVQNHMVQIATTYITASAETNNLSLAVGAPLIAASRARIIEALKRQNNDSLAVAHGSGHRELTEYTGKERIKTNLKTVGAVATFSGLPLVAGAVGGVAIHYSSLIAISGLAACSPLGAAIWGVSFSIALIVVGGMAAHRVRKMAPEQRVGQSTFTLWCSEVSKCFTFMDERNRINILDYHLANWSSSLHECVDEIARTRDNQILILP